MIPDSSDSIMSLFLGKSSWTCKLDKQTVDMGFVDLKNYLKIFKKSCSKSKMGQYVQDNCIT